MAGPSGSGKSTLLHLAGTLDRPTAGTVRVAGLDVAGLADRQLAGLRAGRIGFVFQQFFLAEQQTALGNVADGLLYAGYGRRAAGAGRRRAGAGGAGQPAVGPADPAVRRRAAAGGDRPGGGRQPAMVLADEPTGNLDSATGQAILDLLEELNQAGTTIIVVTHDQAIAGRMDRQVAMLDGRIISDTGRAGTGPAPGPAR